jgi:signal transduction histidine kinase
MRLPLAVKLALVTLPVLAATGLAQWWWLEHAASGPARVAAVAVPLTLPTLCTFLITRMVVARYTQPLIDAYRRVAGGDLITRMPPPPSAEFVTVRDAFTAMSQALDAHVQRLRDADAERRRLFADLAHELATPTTTLLGVAEALQHGAGDRTGALLDHLVHETARLERLIADVRELARLDEPELRLERSPCDVAALARGVTGRAQLAGGHAITCDAASVTIDADPARIEQAVTNLVRNAVVHAGTGRAARIAVTAGPHGDGARITVDDDGPGVPADHLGQLGRRLWRADASRSRERGGGSGLGLSIVLAIAADHGGTVGFARSALGGLRVELILPA